MTIKELRAELERVPKEMDDLAFMVNLTDWQNKQVAMLRIGSLYISSIGFLNDSDNERFIATQAQLPEGWQVTLYKPTLAVNFTK